MAIKLGQSLRQTQSLAMTPQLQQAIKMLTLTHLEMAHMIGQEMVENPVLEEDEKEFNKEELKEELGKEKKEQDTIEGSRDDFDWDSYVNSYNTSSSSPPSGMVERRSKDDFINYENMVSEGETLADHLRWQLKMESLSPDEWRLADEVIYNLKDDGYLGIPFGDILKKFPNMEKDQAQMILEMIHSLDPVGCACFTLKECLLVQAYHLTPTPHLVISILENHLEDLKNKNYQNIVDGLGASKKEIMDAQQVISTFVPKPGRLISSAPIEYIVPDIYIKEIAGEFQITLNNDGIPPLRVSKLYQSIMQNKGDKKAQGYIREKLKSALWLIKSIENRQKTIEKVTRAILEKQPDFFKKGASHLKPMILRDIAEEVGVHESTVSRATTNKYVHTPLGIFELKFFFNSGIGGKDGGIDIAAEGLKLKIKDLIDQEDPVKPLSDQKIADLLKRDKVVVARRTIAKYRELMDIPSSSKRRKRKRKSQK